MNKKVFLAGIVASIVMAMLAMVYEGFFNAGFWAPPTFIAATILRNVQEVAIPVPFLLFPVLLGMMGHMMNSVVLGMVFGKVFGARLASFGTGVAYGAVYGISIFILMWFVILPLIDPVILNLNPYVFALAHIIWGAVIGGMLARTTTN